MGPTSAWTLLLPLASLMWGLLSSLVGNEQVMQSNKKQLSHMVMTAGFLNGCLNIVSWLGCG